MTLIGSIISLCEDSGNGIFSIGFSKLNFTQYPEGGIGTFISLQILSNSAYETLYFFATPDAEISHISLYRSSLLILIN